MKKSIVKITFLDHCITVGGMQPPIECTVYGLLVGEDKKTYYVCTWMAGEAIDENADVYSILKSTVKKIKKTRA